jgi:phosphatidylserine/phosphatidylglycerophosphate/cardiolipin synthase-like enzyme
LPVKNSPSGGELFHVDNSDEDWKVRKYLHDWCQISQAIDIATGYFEIGSLLALGDEWKKVDKIRILMGTEVSRRTANAFAKAQKELLPTKLGQLDASLEAEKAIDAFLSGVPAIAEGLRTGRIECRVYKKDKFHAKAYITHARMEVVGSFALVGSSNFTAPGLSQNVELNVDLRHPGRGLRSGSRHWKPPGGERRCWKSWAAHSRLLPFDVYAKALQVLPRPRAHRHRVGRVRSRMFPASTATRRRPTGP